METNLTLPGGLPLNDGDMATSWKKFKQRFELYLIASGYATKEEKIKCSLFLHLIGEDALDVFNTFEIVPDDQDKLDVLYARFKDYCVPQTNVTYERHIFFLRKQLEDEPVDKWVTELKRLSQTCEFGVLRDDLIKDAIVLGVSDSVVKERLLREKALTLQKAKDLCKVAESSKLHLKNIGTRESVLSVDAARVQNERPQSRFKNTVGQQRTANNQACRFCTGHHKPRECPAYGKSCHNCGSRNHFSSACRKPQSNRGDQIPPEVNSVQVQQQRQNAT